MLKELRPIHDDVSCDVCGRTILKGERTEPYLAPGGQRKVICELCTVHADREGWIRESGGDYPTASRRPEPRRSLIGRLRRRSEEPEEAPVEAPAADAAGPPPIDERPPPELETIRPSRPRDPRHVRAVPTNAEVKVERALELFNASEHPRSLAGIARSLGEPWASAIPDPKAPSEVTVVVAWELSWYRFRIDLGDADEPVVLLGKGYELADLSPEDKDWNASVDADGRVAVGVGSGP